LGKKPLGDVDLKAIAGMNVVDGLGDFGQISGAVEVAESQIRVWQTVTWSQAAGRLAKVEPPRRAATVEPLPGLAHSLGGALAALPRLGCRPACGKQPTSVLNVVEGSDPIVE